MLMVGCLLIAKRLVNVWQHSGLHLIYIPVDLFPVYSTSTLITANQMNLCSNIPHLCAISILNRSTRFKDFHCSNRLAYLYIFVILCGNSWDIESNPCPNSLNSTSHFPCGVCDADVGLEDCGICCDTCNIWYHIDCQGMSSTMYSILNKSSGKNTVWECLKCGMPNFSTTLFDTTDLFWKPMTDLIRFLPCPILRVQYQISSVPPPAILSYSTGA